MKKYFLLLPVCASVLYGCDSVTGPEPFALSLTSVVHTKGFNNETRRYECAYTLTATATGDVGQAQWVLSSGEVRFHDNTTSVFELNAVDLLDLWGNIRIATGASAHASRLDWHPLKSFTILYTLRYQEPDGTFGSQGVSVDCGGPPPPQPSAVVDGQISASWAACTNYTYIDNTCSFVGEGRNMGPDCAIGVRGVTRLYDGSQMQVGQTYEWSLGYRTVRPDEAFTYIIRNVPRTVVNAVTRYATEVTNGAVRC